MCGVLADHQDAGGALRRTGHGVGHVEGASVDDHRAAVAAVATDCAIADAAGRRATFADATRATGRARATLATCATLAAGSTGTAASR